MMRSVYRNLKKWINRGGRSSVYQDWILTNEPDKIELAVQQKASKEFSYRPLISIITPVYNTSKGVLNATIQSVVEQTYNNWELCFVNDSLKAKGIRKFLTGQAKKDQRIKVEPLYKDLGFSCNTNAALAMASGEFAGFLDCGDLLAPYAIFEVVKFLNEDSNTDLIYTDEDKIIETDRRFEPFSKPDFSPDMLRSLNYMHHFLLIRKILGDEIGWLREGFGDGGRYDLVLRATEKTKAIKHLPKILYHAHHVGALTPPPVNTDISCKKALKEHLDRIELKGIITSGVYPGTYRIHYGFSELPLISIIVPNRDNAEYLNCCINSILVKSSYTNFEILVVENNSREESTFQLYEKLQALDPRVSVLVWNHPFNFSSINNWAAECANGQILLYLNNDVEIISSGWLEEMVQQAIRPEIGAVGAKLYYLDGRIQHAGVVVGSTGGIAIHEHCGVSRDAFGYFGRLTFVRNVSAVTGACMMIKKDIFNEVNGFDEHYLLAYGDVDLCLKVQEKGYLNLWTPYAELTHYESKTRGYEDTPEKQARFKKEIDYFLEKWKGVLQKADPYYNPILPAECTHWWLGSEKSN